MNGKQWIVMVTVAGVTAAITAWAFVNPVRVFRTTASIVGVTQELNLLNQPRYAYFSYNGDGLVALALGQLPTTNQVLAMEIDCGSSAAHLVVLDTSTSNTTTFATSASFTIVQQENPKLLFPDRLPTDERYVAQFNIVPTGQLAGGFLTVAGRLHLDTNGCPNPVPVSLDRDPNDKIIGDYDVPNKDQDHKLKGDIRKTRAGQAHLIGQLAVIATDGQTNTVLIPSGHLTLRNILLEFSEVPQ